MWEKELSEKISYTILITEWYSVENKHTFFNANAITKLLLSLVITCFGKYFICGSTTNNGCECL